jgi:hypothetical protein
MIPKGIPPRVRSEESAYREYVTDERRRHRRKDRARAVSTQVSQGVSTALQKEVVN